LPFILEIIIGVARFEGNLECDVLLTARNTHIHAFCLIVIKYLQTIKILGPNHMVKNMDIEIYGLFLAFLKKENPLFVDYDFI
jgi:hypothetical protein